MEEGEARDGDATAQFRLTERQARVQAGAGAFGGALGWLLYATFAGPGLVVGLLAAPLVLGAVASSTVGMYRKARTTLTPSGIEVEIGWRVKAIRWGEIQSVDVSSTFGSGRHVVVRGGKRVRLPAPVTGGRLLGNRDFDREVESIRAYHRRHTTPPTDAV